MMSREMKKCFEEGRVFDRTGQPTRSALPETIPGSSRHIHSHIQSRTAGWPLDVPPGLGGHGDALFGLK